ncbi:MAG: xanthine dehydrogenase family protein subunit M [Chloroflexi bacterium]|jgi:carbon-monoxide dehydrogenase medium subunit|nr:xanthine dehydrogenase family protein subunit M [Chloroflexota bacterium]
MTLWQHYYYPETVEEALERLRAHDGNARIIGGGTDLLLEMQQGRKPAVEALIDVTAIPSLHTLQLENDIVEIGAAVTHTEIVKAPFMAQHATCLVESCGVIGGPQVRNVATLGGNVAHALPAADGTTALVVLDAEVEVAGRFGRQWQPILSLFKGPGISAIDHSREMITRFRFGAAAPNTGSAFKRIMRPQGVSLPILACAVWVRVAPGQDHGSPDAAVIEEARICIGPVRPVPTRARQAERALAGHSLAGGLERAIAGAQSEFSPRTSKHRATAEYRVEMIAVLLQRALPLAVRRALTGIAEPEGIGL